MVFTQQRRILAKVEQLMALVDALETQLAASRTTAANLLSPSSPNLPSSKQVGPSNDAATLLIVRPSGKRPHHGRSPFLG